jgi:hypothetical protein
MTWVKIDDNFPDHPRVIGLSDAAFRAHVAAMCYAARYLTDGHIPSSALRSIGPRKVTSELEASELWIRTDHGWVIRDYLHYNPSKDEVEEKREGARERMARARLAKA